MHWGANNNTYNHVRAPGFESDTEYICRSAYRKAASLRCEFQALRFICVIIKLCCRKRVCNIRRTFLEGFLIKSCAALERAVLL